MQKTIVQPLDLFLHRLTASGTGQAGPAVAPIYWRELSPIDVSGMSCLKLSGPQVMLYSTRIGCAPVRWFPPEVALNAKIDMMI